MAEPRRYIGVRISEQGHRYIQLVADRDNVNYSEALRRLLAVGARTDMEAHDDSRTGTRVGEGGGVRDVGPDGDGRGDRHGDPSGNGVPRLPHPSATEQGGIGEAIGHLVHAGLNPATVEAGENSGAA